MKIKKYTRNILVEATKGNSSLSLYRKRRLKLIGTGIAIIALLMGSVFFVMAHRQGVNAIVMNERPINGKADTGKDYLINAFKPGSETAVLREDTLTGLETYRMAIDIGDGKYWTMQLRPLSGSNVNSMAVSDVSVVSKIVNWRDEAWSLVGGSWMSYGGNGVPGDHVVRQTSSVGGYAEWTMADADLATVQVYATSNQNILSVAVDGDNTAATKLPTAQDLVNGGTLVSTALVANGGTLEPTDRVIDAYSAGASGKDFDIAENLSGTHTIRLTLTPYKNPASAAGDRMAITNGFVTNDDLNLSDTGVTLRRIASLNTTDSAYEYAGRFKPAGTSNFEWAGNTMHHNDEQINLAVNVNGRPVSLENGQIAVGRVEIVRESTLRHPELNSGNTPMANVNVTYRMLPGVGLDVTNTFEHLVDGQSNVFYPLMYPVGGGFNRGSTICSTQDFALIHNDGSSVGYCETGDLGWFWSTGSGSAVLLEVKDINVAVNNWQNPGNSGLYLEDRSAGIKKMYLGRVSNGSLESYNQGDIWTAHGIYRAKVFNNADAVLARVDDTIGTDSWTGAGANGGSSQHILHSADDLQYTVEEDLALLDRVEVDGVVINKGSNYVATSGSTVITLLADYLNGLTVGTHQIETYFTNGVKAMNSFEVTSQVPGVPNTSLFGTSDGATVAVATIFLAIITALLGTVVIVGRKIALRRRSKQQFRL